MPKKNDFKLTDTEVKLMRNFLAYYSEEVTKTYKATTKKDIWYMNYASWKKEQKELSDTIENLFNKFNKDYQKIYRKELKRERELRKGLKKEKLKHKKILI